jgi:hypothetical protein
LQGGAVGADLLQDGHQGVQDDVAFLAGVKQALRGVPQLGRVAPPQPVGQQQVPVDVPADAARRRGGMVGGEQLVAVGRIGRVQRRQVDPVVPPLEHRERERAARQRLQVVIRQQPPDQGILQAELGRVAVGLGEAADRVEHGLQRLRHQRTREAPPRAGPAHPGRQHVRHRVLLGEGEHDLARQPAEQECLDLGGAHPQRPPEVTVAPVVDDAVSAA